jgi:FMN phosphatase YigB (HAD superfamily)
VSDLSLPIISVIGTNPIPRFVELKLSSDEVGLKKPRSGDTCLYKTAAQKMTAKIDSSEIMCVPSTLATDKESAIS